MSETPPVTDRIREAYAPENLRLLGHRLVDVLAEHLDGVEQSRGRVLNWNDPAENRVVASDRLDAPKNAALVEAFERAAATVLSRGQNLHDPRYVGHQVPAPVPLAGLFDAIGSVTNQVMAIYEMGPFVSAVEEVLVERLGARIGYQPGTFAGFATHGGSLANLTALLTARNVLLGDSYEAGVPSKGPRPVIVSHAEAHYCISRSAGILGLGTNQVVKAELDDRRRIDPQRLDETLGRLRAENVPIVAVAAGACATPIGAFDPLNDLADVCERHKVWLHVDAAHGGAALFSQTHRHLLDGLQRADSLIWDAHKMLFVPALCAFVFYRDREHRFRAFHQDAPYLFDPSAPELIEADSGLKTIECTKRAAALPLWGVWSLFGPELFGDLVDRTFALGRAFHQKLQAADDFEPLHEPECNIVAFRHRPERLQHATPAEVGSFQLELRKRVIRSGAYYLVPTSKDGTGALRVTLINPLTTPDHLDGLLATLREEGERLLDGR